MLIFQRSSHLKAVNFVSWHYWLSTQLLPAAAPTPWPSTTSLLLSNFVRQECKTTKWLILLSFNIAMGWGIWRAVHRELLRKGFSPRNDRNEKTVFCTVVWVYKNVTHWKWENHSYNHWRKMLRTIKKSKAKEI